MKKFIGFDPLPLGENGFELFKDQKPFLSLYHDCKLRGISYDQESLKLEFEKVFDNGYGPTIHSRSQLVFKGANIIKIFGNDSSGNFEDVNELSLIAEQDDHLTIRLNLGAITFTLDTSSIELEAPAH